MAQQPDTDEEHAPSASFIRHHRTESAALRAENAALRAHLATLHATQAQAQRIEQELRATQRRLEATLRHIIHEIRTPMTSVKAGLQLALRRLDSLEASNAPIEPEHLHRLRDVLEIVRRQVDTENELILRMLEAARKGEAQPRAGDFTAP